MLKKLLGTSALLATIIGLGFTAPASATTGWQGIDSPTYETIWSNTDGAPPVASYWFLTSQAYLVASGSGYKTYQTSYTGFQEYWATDPALPSVQEYWTNAYDGSSFVSEYGAGTSGCLPQLYPGSWLLSPCSYSNYNTSGHMFITPRLEMCAGVGAGGLDWEYGGGIAYPCYYYVDY